MNTGKKDIVRFCLLCDKPIPEERMKTNKQRYCSNACNIKSYKLRKYPNVGEEEREFIGFFWGDGSLTSHKEWPNDGNKFVLTRPIISISQRADNFSILEWCKKRFGGHLTKRQKRKTMINGKYIQNPVYIWVVTKANEVEEILRVLRKGKLPNTKQRQLDTFEELLKMRMSYKKTHGKKTFRNTQENVQKMALLAQKLSDLKKYQE